LKHLYLLSFILFFSTTVFSQDSLRIEQFNITADRMNTFMSKEGSSLEHMKVVLRQLKELSDVDEAAYAHIAKKYDDYVFNERIIYVGEMTELHELERALVSLAILEQEYPENKQVQDLSLITKASTSERLLKNLKESRTSFTIEPSLSVYTIGKPAKEYSFFDSPGLGMMYGLGGYKTYKVYEKDRRAFKKNYSYSQIGLKLDYYHGKNSTPLSLVSLNYLCTQISWIMNRSIGLDLGYTAMINTQNTTLPSDKGFFTTNLSLNFPMNFMSFSVNARLLSDFDATYHIQYGFSLKYIFKMGMKISQADIDGINTSIDNINIE